MGVLLRAEGWESAQTLQWLPSSLWEKARVMAMASAVLHDLNPFLHFPSALITHYFLSLLSSSQTGLLHFPASGALPGCSLCPECSSSKYL